MTTPHDSNDSKFKTISKQRSKRIPSLTLKQWALPQEIKGRRTHRLKASGKAD